MDTTIIVAIITGVLTLAGTIITVVAGNRKTETNLKTAQAVTDTKIDHLTAAVEKHNNFASRLPVIEEQIKVINHRIADLEKEE